MLNKTACEQKWLLAVSKRLKAAPDIPSSVVTTKTGTLGNFTTGSVADDGYSTIQTAVLNNGWSYLSLETNNKEKKVKLNFIKVKNKRACNSRMWNKATVVYNFVLPSSSLPFSIFVFHFVILSRIFSIYSKTTLNTLVHSFC